MQAAGAEPCSKILYLSKAIVERVHFSSVDHADWRMPAVQHRLRRCQSGAFGSESRADVRLVPSLILETLGEFRYSRSRPPSYIFNAQNVFSIDGTKSEKDQTIHLLHRFGQHGKSHGRQPVEIGLRRYRL